MSIHYQALTLSAPCASFTMTRVELPSLETGEVAVRLHAAAFNHRDLWIHKGQYAGLKFPAILGSDGAGVVERIGSGVDSSWMGRKVLINPSLDWGASEHSQGPDFRILGLPDSGTFAEWVKVPVSNVAALPNHLSFEEGAALPLAGLTAYRALFTKGGIKPGEKLLITGIGGGVALALLRFAVAARAQVFVTSGSEEKLLHAMAQGAAGGVNYREINWAEKLAALAGPFDCVIDSAGGAGFSQLCDLTRSGGKLIFFGATMGNPPEMVLRKVFWRQLNLLGTTMGSPSEFAAMVKFVGDFEIRPVIDSVYPFTQADEALRRMNNGGQFGKLVLKIQ